MNRHHPPHKKWHCLDFSTKLRTPPDSKSDAEAKEKAKAEWLMRNEIKKLPARKAEDV
jgi:hypothetical protein